eukprot:scaffold5664_cov115-Isochrysis_galbana.AAC.30
MPRAAHLREDARAVCIGVWPVAVEPVLQVSALNQLHRKVDARVGGKVVEQLDNVGVVRALLEHLNLVGLQRKVAVRLGGAVDDLEGWGWGERGVKVTPA